jgi:pteridine reductase
MDGNEPAGFTLRGAVALVTGAKRIGRAVALALAGKGADVIVHYNRSQADAEQTCAEARALGVRAWALQADLADAQACEGIVPSCIALAGRLDILVHAASVFEKSTLLDFTPEDLARNLQLHALSALQMGRAMANSTGSGRIVLFLDTGIVRHDRRHVAYHLSKQAAFSLMRMMALEFAPGITVNAVAPGLILAPPGEDPQSIERLRERVPLKRTGSIEAVVRAVMFLVESDYVTGQVLFVDGGEHLRGGPYGL